MPISRPVSIAQELRLGGVDGLLKTIADHPELKHKDAVKRLALVEVILWGTLGERADSAEVSVCASRSLGMSLEELTMEAKVQAQNIPPQMLVS